MFYPIIGFTDKDSFFIVVDFQYADELNLKYKPKERYYLKCIVDKNNFYTIGKMQDKQIEDLKRIIDNPSKRIVTTPSILEYLNKAYYIR